MTAALAVDWVGALCDRYDELMRDARNLDDDYDHLGLSLATEAVYAVEELFPSYDDDEPFMRFACLIWAMQRALDEARDDYREVRPHPRSGWESEAFPKAALGL